jgi:hypothetical protein
MIGFFQTEKRFFPKYASSAVYRSVFTAVNAGITAIITIITAAAFTCRALDKFRDNVLFSLIHRH